MRGLLAGVLVVLCIPATFAQPSGLYYEVRYYYAGQPDSFTSYWLVPPAIAPWPGVGQYGCDRARSTSTDTRNPNLIEWDDPDRPGRICSYQEVEGGPLYWLADGSYEAGLRAWGSGGVSLESPRAAFMLGDAESTPSGLRVIR